MEANEKLVEMHQKKVFASEAALLTADVAVKFADFMDTKTYRDFRLLGHSKRKAFDYFITHVYRPL